MPLSYIQMTNLCSDLDEELSDVYSHNAQQADTIEALEDELIKVYERFELHNIRVEAKHKRVH